MTQSLIDYHLHTSRCGHAVGDMDEYVLRGRELDLRQLGFCDHLPLLHLEDPHLAMPLDELPLYIADFRRLQQEHPEMVMKLGIEADYVPGYVGETRQLLASHAFDYVMGSVHYVDGWAFDDPRYLDQYEGCDLMGLWQRYFELLADAAESGLFDILAHPDLVKKFGMRPAGDMAPVLRRCVERIAASGVAVEVNTAGMRRPVGEVYPSPALLRMLVEAGVPVTLGSDAHSPEEVGAGYEVMPEFLTSCGVRELAVFSGRRRAAVAL
ncbi:MAG: histidinol-phosphatase HisJ family protein [Candidatus Geothermincolia bacterium]